MDSKTMSSNPYDYIKEVSNPAWFAGRREELAQLGGEVEGLTAPQAIAPMVAIVGERRIGKTSVSLRVQEICESHRVLPLRISPTDITAEDSWEFWNEIFHGLLSIGSNRLNLNSSNLPSALGTPDENFRINLNDNQLGFWTAYSHSTTRVPPNPLVYEGLKSLITEVIAPDRNGVLLIIDEAHLLNQSQGGMCISGVLRVGVGVAGQGAGP